MDQLKSIRTFINVAEAESFIGAADKMGLSAAITTRYIAALEERLGTKLFRRSTRRVSLTEHGAAYLSRVRAIVSELDETETAVSASTLQPAGTLRVASPIGFGASRLAPLIQEYMLRFPEVRLHVTLTDAAIDIVHERIDVAIVPSGLEMGLALISRQLTTSEVKIVASPRYLKRHHGLKSLGELASHPLLVHRGAAINATKSLMTVLGIKTPSTFRRIESNNVELLCRLALEGAGVAVIPGYMVDGHIERGDLIHLFPTERLPDLKLRVVFASRMNMAATARTFVNFMIDQLGEE